MTIKVLVVDNNPVILKAVSTILNQEGCLVKSVGTGLEAIECLDAFFPDIVFTDLVMPLVSGELLCKIIRNTDKYNKIFIVVLSGIVLEDKDRILREIDCDVCIAKGNLSEIRAHIKEALLSYLIKGQLREPANTKNTHIPKGLKPSRIAHELLLEKEHHKSIISNLDEGILELNHEGKVVAANPAILKILDCTEVSIIGKTLPDLRDWGTFHNGIANWNDQQLIRKGMEVFEIYEESPLICEEKILSASLIPVIEGEGIFGLCIFRDITRQYNAEQRNREISDAVRLVKKMDAMSCMAGGFAHDFNNLLTVICGNLDILSMADEAVEDSDLKLLVDQAKKASLVAVDLTRQISWFSHFGIVKREVCGAEPIVEKAVKDFFHNNLQGAFSLHANLKNSLVSIDPEEIIKAIHNVLQNSREAVENGVIRISVENTTLAGPELIAGQYVSAGDYVRVDIHDDGPGIDSDQAFRIFDPYYSTKERGSSKGVGLGLTFVYATMRNHGGNVLVSSGNDGGTTVTLYLPVFAEPDFSQGVSMKNSHPGRIVLLVDSDQQMQEIGKIMLKHLGFDARAMSKNVEAVNELQFLAADLADSAPPLVILDIVDSNGESAASTCRLLRNCNPEIKIIAMCGVVLDPIMADYQKYGFDNALPKPYNIDSLRHILHTALRS